MLPDYWKVSPRFERYGIEKCKSSVQNVTQHSPPFTGTKVYVYVYVCVFLYVSVCVCLCVCVFV